MFTSLQCQLRLSLANRTFQSQHNLLRSLGLLVKHGLGLTTITGLFAIVSTLSLREKRRFAGFILSDFVLSVLFAGLAFAVGAAGFGDVDLEEERG